MSSEPPRIAVFGGSGYIGGRLSAYLSAHQYDVTPISSRDLDVLTASAPDFQRLVDGCDAVVSLVGANENAAANDPLAALNLAVTAARCIGEAVAKCGVRRLVHFSTIHVYGILSGDVDELRPPAPVHAYGAAHAAAENILQTLARDRALDVVVFRLANAVGPPATPGVDRWTLLTNDLARTLAETGKLKLRSAGHAWRDFIGLSEVCRATLHALRLPALNGARVFNLGTGKVRRVLDVAQDMADFAEPLLGRRPELLRASPQGTNPDLPMFTVRVDALKRTGFTPDSQINEELRRLIEFAIDHFGEHA